MAGISISVLPIKSQEWIEYLDEPTEAPAWSGNAFSHKKYGGERIVEDPSFEDFLLKHKKEPETKQGILFKKILDTLCKSLPQHCEKLTQLDSVTGDGDLGNNVQSFLKVMEEKIDSIPFDEIGTAWFSLGQLIQSNWGGTSGSLFSIFVLSVSNQVTSFSEENIDWISVFQNALESVKRAGGAQVGDKTLIDMIHPFLQQMKKNANDLLQAKKVCEESLEAIKKMKAKKGRASYVKNENEQDPGAYLLFCIITETLKVF